MLFVFCCNCLLVMLLLLLLYLMVLVLLEIGFGWFEVLSIVVRVKILLVVDFIVLNVLDFMRFFVLLRVEISKG